MGTSMDTLRLLKAHSVELNSLDIGSQVERVHISDLSPLQFSTQYVARNKPVIITGAIDSWPACRLWDSAYLSQHAGSTLVTVDLTPTGRADAVTQVVPDAAGFGHAARTQQQVPATLPGNSSDSKKGYNSASPDHRARREDCQTSSRPPTAPNPTSSATSTANGHIEDSAPHSGGSRGTADTEPWFLTPCEVKMTVGAFFKLFRESRATQGPTRVVPYVQHQNSSFTEEWAFLSEDTQPHLTWADEVFGGPPAATNIWVGDDRSVTSFHKDAFENLYAVVRGTKVFHLLPPSEVYRMNMRRYPTATYVLQSPPDTEAQPSGLSNPHHAHCTCHPANTGHSTAVSADTPAEAAEAAVCAAHSCDTPASSTQSASWYEIHTSDGQLRQLQLGVDALVGQLNQPAVEVLWSDVEPAGCDNAVGRCVPDGDTQAYVCEHSGMDGMVPGAGHCGHQLEANHGPQHGSGHDLFHDPDLPPPLVAEVGPGEVLFLPALWYHRVSQKCTEPDHDYVVAVNFWYDMAFDHRWAHFQLMEGLAVAAGLADAPPSMATQR